MVDSLRNLHDDTEWAGVEGLYKSREGYILGFFEVLAARHSDARLGVLGLFDGLEKEKNDDWR